MLSRPSRTRPTFPDGEVRLTPEDVLESLVEECQEDHLGMQVGQPAPDGRPFVPWNLSPTRG
jgi:hypothetical protein